MAFDLLLQIIADCGQKALLVPFQNKACQSAGCIRRSVNADSIGPNLGGNRGRVPVHNKFAVICVAREERLSNGQKIIALLAIQCDAGPYAGMAEEVVADGY